MMPTSVLPAPLTGLRKAAVFLMGVGEEVSAELLRQLSVDEVRLITSEIATTPSVGADQMISVFREFEALTAEGRLFTLGGSDCARRLLENAFGAESARKFLVAPEPEPDVSPSGALEDSDPEHLSLFLKNEHPQTIAVVLSSISGKLAGALLQSLPEETRSQVALRMATLDRVSPEAFQKIMEAIGSKLKTARTIGRTDGVRALASLMNYVEPPTAEALLAALGERNPQVADSIRNLMFVFDDILQIGSQEMKVLVGKLDRKVLTMALKGSSVKMRSHFTSCMSQRSAEMLQEDLEALGPVRIRDVENAQKNVIAAIRELQSSGAISAANGGDEYVV